MLITVHRRPKSSLIVRAFAALLAVALVGSQVAGQVHRVKHAPVHAGQLVERALLFAADGGNGSQHDCAAYDAAALGDGPPVTHSVSTEAFLPCSVPTAQIVAVVGNLPHLPFQARAPPRV